MEPGAAGARLKPSQRGAGTSTLGQVMLERRAKERASFEKAKQEIIERNKVSVTSDITSRFDTGRDETHKKLALHTVGLHSIETFRKTREQLYAKSVVVNPSLERSKRERMERKSKLSFLGDDSEEEEEDWSIEPAKKIKVVKNPDVETSFLPDKGREMNELKRIEQLKEEYLREQQVLKKQEIQVAFTLFEGGVNLGFWKERVAQGTTIGQFLQKIQKNVKELRAFRADNLMFVKEDLILPHDYTFHHFIQNKVKGKSGPLFNFDVHHDIQLVVDARIERKDSHAAKIVDKIWYKRNKKVFPASRWEEFDPNKKFKKYTLYSLE